MQQCHSGVEGRSVEVLLVYRSLRLLRILQSIVMGTVGNTVLYNAAVSQWRSVLEYWSTWVVVLLVHRSLKDTPSTTVLQYCGRWSVIPKWVLYVGGSTHTTGAPQKLIMSVDWLNKSINTQTITRNNSPTRRAKCAWWEEEEGAKVPKNGVFNMGWQQVVEFTKQRTNWCDTSHKNSQVGFYEGQYHGCISLHFRSQ